MRVSSSGSKVTKIVVAVLIVVALVATAGISYYAVTRPASPIVSPTPTPTVPSTPTPTSAPTASPTASSSPAPSPTLLPTPSSPYPTQTPTPTLTSAPTSSANPSPTPSPSEIPRQEKVRDSVMTFIRTNHPETVQFMTNLSWTGGRATPSNIVGAETYKYYSQGWNVTITYPVVPNPIYKIIADYSAIGISIPYRIVWQGTWQDDVTNETSYVFAQ